MDPLNHKEHKARLLAALDRLREQVIRDEVYSVVAICVCTAKGRPNENIHAEARVHIKHSHGAPAANAMAGVITEFARDGMVPITKIKCSHHDDDEKSDRPTLN